jgi:hypothetical protein
MSYPAHCLRGISDRNSLDEEGIPTGSLFQFNKANREDGYVEESISWLDDEEVFDILFSQRNKKDEIQFKFGAVLLSREKIDRIMRINWIRTKLLYERHVIPDNKYHGNLLVDSNTSKQTRNSISASIALQASEEVIPNKYLNQP